MTPKRYRDTLDRLRLTQKEAARLMGIAPRTSWGYANGELIPKIYELYLDELLEKHEADPIKAGQSIAAAMRRRAATRRTKK